MHKRQEESMIFPRKRVKQLAGVELTSSDSSNSPAPDARNGNRLGLGRDSSPLPNDRATIIIAKKVKKRKSSFDVVSRQHPFSLPLTLDSSDNESAEDGVLPASCYVNIYLRYIKLFCAEISSICAPDPTLQNRPMRCGYQVAQPSKAPIQHPAFSIQ